MRRLLNEDQPANEAPPANPAAPAAAPSLDTSDFPSAPKAAPPKPQGTFSWLGGVAKSAAKHVFSAEERFGQTLGEAAATLTPEFKGAQQAEGQLQETNAGLYRSIQKAKAQGKDVTSMQRTYDDNQGYLGQNEGMQQVTPSITKSGEQIAGEGLAVATDIASAGELPGTSVGKGASLARKALSGAVTGSVLGASASAAQAMKEDKSLGDVAKQAATGGAVGGAIGGAAPVIGAGIRKAADKISTATANRLIRPLAKEFSFGKNPGRALVEEGITGSSFDEIGQNASSKLREVGQQIGKALEGKEGTINLTSAADMVDSEMKNAAESNQPALLERLKQLKDTIVNKRTIDAEGNIVNSGARDLENMTPAEANEVKQAIGKHMQWTGQAFDKEINRLGSKVYGNVRGKVEDAVPEIAGLNERWGNLLSVTKSVQRAGQMYEAQSARRGDLTDVATGIGAVGEAVKGDWKGAGLVLLADAARHVLGTPAASTNIAQVLSKMSEQDMATLAEHSPTVAKIIQTAGKNVAAKAASAISDSGPKKPDATQKTATAAKPKPRKLEL